MILLLLLLAAGLVLLIAGADFLVRGVSALAEALGVPPLVIGLTVVAFGTSTPEVVVNIMAAAKGDTALSFGNLVGSCAINIGFVLALTAIVRPLDVESTVVSREIPMMLLGIATLVVLAEDRFFNGSEHSTLVRSDGIVLLLLFVTFLYYTVRAAIRHQGHDALIVDVAQTVKKPRAVRPLWLSAVFTVGGLIGVAGGGRLTVYAAVKIAESLGVPANLIGLTLVSFGTTLPELTTGLIAARRGHGDIAVGNVVGSNIFNILLIGGTVATIRPMPMPPGAQIDLLFMAGLAVALWPIALRGPRKVTRGEGILLLSVYLGFMVFRSVSALRG